MDDWSDPAAPEEERRPSISEVTRSRIFDALRIGEVSWSGAMDEVDFLNRLFDLSKLPSNDRRYSDAAGDIWKHRVDNFDWPADWVYGDTRFQLLRGPDERFLRFLCEMLHPLVRKDPAVVEDLRAMFNEQLRADGWELYPSHSISGRPIFSARRVVATGQRAVAALKDVAASLGTAEHIAQQITRIEAAVDADPALAIGSAKELIETVCKSILRERGLAVGSEWDVPRLVKETAKSLSLTPDDVDAATKGAETVRRILGALASVAGGLAELRNLYGTGHGKAPDARGLGARHAHLAVGAATTLVVFLHETHLARPKTSR